MSCDIRLKEAGISSEQLASPQIPPELAQILLLDSFEKYTPELAQKINEVFTQFSLLIDFFGNGMPNVLAHAIINETARVVVPLIMNGDNWQKFIQDLVYLQALSLDRGHGLGKIVKNLSALLVFADFRQDRPSMVPLSAEDLIKLKIVPKKGIEPVAMMADQTPWTAVVANLLHAAGVKQVVIVDGHSGMAAQHLTERGIEVINITTARLMIDTLKSRGLLDDSLETIVVGVDLGNLALADKLRTEDGFELGIINKKRIPMGNGTKSRTEHKLVYGNVSGKRVVLFDDMISSGGTLLNTVDLLAAAGAKEILVCASHAVFCGDYEQNLRKLLAKDLVKIVMVSSTLPQNNTKEGTKVSLPSITTEDGGEKQVEVLNVDNFIAYMIYLMMKYPNSKDLRKQIGKHLLPQPDPRELYQRITESKLPELPELPKLPKKNVVARVDHSGNLQPLPKKNQLKTKPKKKNKKKRSK